MILRNSSLLSSVSFCDLGVKRYVQELVKFLRCHLCQEIFKMVGLASTSKDLGSFIAMWARRSLTMFIHSDLYCFVWNHRKPGKIYPFDVALNLLLCGFRLFMFCWTRYHTVCWRKIDKVFIKMDTRSWKFPFKWLRLRLLVVFSLKELIIVIQKL